jgi:succinate dehydrogenase / fumarate reductase cytochrome b subunit
MVVGIAISLPAAEGLRRRRMTVLKMPGDRDHAAFADIASGWFGRFVLFGYTLALVYHALNGIRHLMWDAGIGLNLKAANRSGITVYVLTLVATLAIWISAYQSMGASQ